ncbi:MAG: class IV adenylate cyclase [Candidatus Thorarchaeota archaeon]
MFEIEIKVQVSDPDLIRKKFENHQGAYKFFLTHKDIYYNMPKGLRDFKKTDEALRLRTSIRYDKNNKYNPQEVDYLITYKGKKIDKLTKSREEIEIKIEDFEKMREILELLGFQEVLTVMKERELYEFKLEDHKFTVLLDYIPILQQYFVEAEYLSELNEDIAESRERLFSFLKLLGMDKKDSIRKSYLELILEKNK